LKDEFVDPSFHQHIIKYWFDETDKQQWYKVDVDFDKEIKQRFSDVFIAAERGELYRWRSTIEGRLAEIIVLDQFSRNIYRNSPKAFACDGLALLLAQEAVAADLAKLLQPERRAFLYMPYMHSESVMIHGVALTLFSDVGMEHNLDFEHKHKKIIDQFGRYPHRNEILGRQSTAEEIAFLKEPGSSF